MSLMTNALLADFEEAMKHAVRDTQNEAIRLSSGPYRQSQLDRMDHPYAKRHGRAMFPLRVINWQTGEFRSDWSVLPTIRTSDQIVGRLINDDPKLENPIDPEGNFLTQGTRFMFARPIDVALQEYADQKLERFVKRELEKFERTDFIIR